MMRATLTILLAVVMVAGLIRFYPSSDVEGREEGADTELAEDRGPVQFIGRSDPSPGPVPPLAREPAITPAPGTGSAPPTGMDFGREWERLEADEEENRLASALLHGDPEGFRRALEVSRLELSPTRKAFLTVFAEALAGNRERALAVVESLSEADLTARQKGLIEAALGGPDAGARPAGTGSLALAMEMRLGWREAEHLARTRRHVQAARAFSDLLLAAIRAPWECERELLLAWSDGLSAAQRHYRWDPDGGWPSVEMVVEDGDTLTHIRKRFLASRSGALMCTGLIERANRLAGYLQPGQTLLIPTDPALVVVDLSSRWLLYMLGEEVAAAWEVGVGREGEETITGEFVVGPKQKNPMWFPRGQDPVPFGDPENPLGTRWIPWLHDGSKTGYGFHGTWAPESIGGAQSDGCIRMSNEHVELLSAILPQGARIRVQE